LNLLRLGWACLDWAGQGLQRGWGKRQKTQTRQKTQKTQNEIAKTIVFTMQTHF